MVLAFTRLLMVVVLLAGLGLAAGFWWLYSPMTLNLPAGSPVLDLEIEPGMRPAQVAEAVVASGAQTPVQLLQWWFRVSGQARQIKAGSYEITPGMTPRKLLAMLVRELRNLSAMLVDMERGQSARDVVQAHRVWGNKVQLTERALHVHTQRSLTALLERARVIDQTVKGLLRRSVWDELGSLVLNFSNPRLLVGVI